MKISCERVIERPAADVYEYLSDLSKHWRLLGDSLVEANLNDSRDHANLVVRVPWLPVRRRIDTRVDETVAPELLRGTARAGATTASIEWRISAPGGETDGKDMSRSNVRFSAGIHPGNAIDSVLVRIADGWLHRRCDIVLESLARELEGQR
jgi:hypothetical protein